MWEADGNQIMEKRSGGGRGGEGGELSHLDLFFFFFFSLNRHHRTARQDPGRLTRGGRGSSTPRTAPAGCCPQQWPSQPGEREREGGGGWRDGGIRGGMIDRWSTSRRSLFLQSTPFSLPPPLRPGAQLQHLQHPHTHPKTRLRSWEVLMGGGCFCCS